MLKVVLLLLKRKFIEIYVLVRTLVIIVFIIESIPISIATLKLNISV